MSEQQTDIRFPFGMSHEHPRTDFEIPAMQKPGIIFSVSATVDKITYNENTPLLHHELNVETWYNDGTFVTDKLLTKPIVDAGTLSFDEDQEKSIEADERAILGAAYDTWLQENEIACHRADREIIAKSVGRKCIVAAGMSVALTTAIVLTVDDRPLEGYKAGLGVIPVMAGVIFTAGAFLSYLSAGEARSARLEHAAKADRILSFIDIVERFGLSYKNKKIDTPETTIQDAKTE